MKKKPSLAEDPVPALPQSRVGMYVVFAGIALLLLLIGYWFFGRISEGYLSARLLLGHEVTQGTITKDGMFRDPSGYAVLIEGERYTGQAGTHYDKGDTVEIAYLPGDPSINRPTDMLWFEALFAGAAVIIGPVVLALIFLSKPAETRAARRKRLGVKLEVTDRRKKPKTEYYDPQTDEWVDKWIDETPDEDQPYEGPYR